MALNEWQTEFLAEVRSQPDPGHFISREFGEVKPQAYLMRDFRELLFAIDATNQVANERWYEVMVAGMVRHADWIDRENLNIEAIAEIGDYAETYGVGEYALELVVTLLEEARGLPNNAESFMRRIFISHFNGIQPLTGHALFVLKRYIEPRRPLTERDAAMVMHVCEETKGLECAKGAERYLAVLLKESVLHKDVVVDWGMHRKVCAWLAARDEYREAEITLIQLLNNDDVPLPPVLQEKLPRGLGQFVSPA